MDMLYNLTNKINRSSFFHGYPITTESYISGCFSTIEYISEVPILTPFGLRVASERP